MSLVQPDLSSGPQSVDRALQVLELLADWGSGGVSEVAAAIGVHKSTAFRLLGALEARELVEQTNDRKYRLGFGLLRLARRVNVELELTDQARPITEELAKGLGESINVAVLREHYVVNVVQSRGEASVASQNWIGQLTPLHATSSGKVLLAHAPDDVVALAMKSLTKVTPYTLTQPGLLAAQLERVRRDGYAQTNEEMSRGACSVAVPIRHREGAVIAALGVVVPTLKRDKARLVAALQVAASGISRSLG